MNSTWIIVADGSRARLFKSSGALSHIHEIETLTHPESRLHEQMLTSDLPGCAFDSTGEGRHAMDNKVEPKRHEIEEFARQIASHLDKARSDNKFKRLIIIAAPNMLGELRNTLSTETKKLIRAEIDKDLTQHTVDDIQQYL